MRTSFGVLLNKPMENKTKMGDGMHIRTVRFYTPELSAKKSGLLNRAMKDYHHSRSIANDYFRENGTEGFGYSDITDFYKDIHRRPDIDLAANTIKMAIRTAEQNWGEYEKRDSVSEPRAGAADTYGLEPSATRIYYTNGRYYLNIHTGPKRVQVPLRVSDGEYHQSVLPDPDAVPPKQSELQRTVGVPLDGLSEDVFPGPTVKVGGSSFNPVSSRTFNADLAFYSEKPISRGDSVDDCRYLLGVDRGRNQLAYAALYDRQEDHVVDWWNRGGDEVRHYLDEFSERISELQAAQVWDEMEDARSRRFRYKKQIDYEIANAIVDLSRGKFSIGIVLEDLSDMSRLGAYSAEKRRFNEWSYYRLEQCIRDKAEPYDIPVQTIDPSYTSVECSRCGEDEDTDRHSVHFECGSCGYEQHADANAAVNIAKRVG